MCTQRALLPNGKGFACSSSLLIFSYCSAGADGSSQTPGQHTQQTHLQGWSHEGADRRLHSAQEAGSRFDQVHGI